MISGANVHSFISSASLSVRASCSRLAFSCQTRSVCVWGGILVEALRENTWRCTNKKVACIRMSPLHLLLRKGGLDTVQ